MILNFPKINYIQSVNPAPSKPDLSFRGSSFLLQDEQELSQINRVKLKDKQGKSVEGVITENDLLSSSNNPCKKKFILTVNNQSVGYAVVHNLAEDNSTLYLDGLYTKDTKHDYIGAGTELLKCAVNESIKRGFNGDITTFASNPAASPSGFYFKNNFMAIPPKKGTNASIHYALKNNIPVINNGYNSDVSMHLDKQGAKALLEEKRLYETRLFQKITEKNINGILYSANLIQSPYKNEFFVLIANENEEKDRTCCVLSFYEHEKQNGKKDIIVKDLETRYYAKDTIKNFALETVERIAEEQDYDKIIFEKIF